MYTCRMSSALFISIVGPPLHEWNPLPYVKSWIAKGRHSAIDLGKCKAQKMHKATEARMAVWKCCGIGRMTVRAYSSACLVSAFHCVCICYCKWIDVQHLCSKGIQMRCTHQVLQFQSVLHINL